MIEKLRKRFIIITMIALGAIVILIFSFIYFSVYSNNQNMVHSALDKLVQNDGIPFDSSLPDNVSAGDAAKPEEAAPQSDITAKPNPRDNSYGEFQTFSAKVDQSGNIYDIWSLYRPQDITDEEYTQQIETTIISNVQLALSSGQTSGSIGNLQFVIAERDYGKVVVFADGAIGNRMLAQMMYSTLIIGCIGIVILFFVVRKLSYMVIRPVAESFERQKRFISDASHELKTPLSIISANADVLKSNIGENKWLSYIEDQSQRMNKLVGDLLMLAKVDETQEKITFAQFDLSETVMNTLLTFESIAYEQQKDFTYDIEEQVLYSGDEQSLRQLLFILIDNAVKHSAEHGQIRTDLHRSNGKIHLSVFNTGQGIDESETQKVFERFYRSDASRSRQTGGYGLGLAIAKAIVDTHKGRISVQSKKGEWVRFSVTL